MADAEAVIVADGLTKRFTTLARSAGLLGGLRSLVAPTKVVKDAVRDVSFTVHRGELVALLGPNGAGKSTTIKMLVGILLPTAGSVRVAGLAPHRNRERNARNVGVVFGHRSQLWWDLSVLDSLGVLRDIFDIGASAYRATLAELDTLLGLSEFWETRLAHLSLGQRVRGDLAAALLHDPDIIVLDEPTIGMDVVVKEQVREFLRFQVRERGRTVLITTHDMTEVARLAQRILLINGGRLVFDGAADDLRRRFAGTWRIRATLAGTIHEVDDLCRTATPPGLRVLLVEGTRVVLGPASPDHPAEVREGLLELVRSWPVVDVGVEETDLEDVMREAYSREWSP